MKRCLLLPFNFFKPVLGTRYKLCYSILTLFLKNSQDYVVMISHFGQKSQINHQTCFSTEARMHIWLADMYLSSYFACWTQVVSIICVEMFAKRKEIDKPRSSADQKNKWVEAFSAICLYMLHFWMTAYIVATDHKGQK